jgi:hypothetical protein
MCSRTVALTNASGEAQGGTGDAATIFML